MFEVGEQVGAYTIVRRLGAGGMGEVYLGRHRHIARDAAIKVLLPELSQNEDVVARFFTEARATATIRHPGIVEILDCDIHRTGRAYIVMEFLDGENLAERLVRQRSFAEDQGTAGVILAQAAGAVGAAHAKGIVHRDLKPDNVFLVGAPDTGAPTLVKILDFGVAKLVSDDGQGRNKTRTGSLLGTPTYMSPEQCRGAGSIDHRTDVYALGCMAFELLAGRPPFVRDGAGEVLVAHLVEKPPQLSSLVPSVPPELDALIGQMLEKDAAARPQSMAEIASRVEGIFGIVSTFTPPAEGLSGAMRLPGAGRTPAFGAAVSSTPTAAGQAFQRPATPLPGKTAAAPSSPSPSAPAPAPAPHVIAGGTRVMQAVSSRTTLSDSASEKSTRQRTPPPSVPRRRWMLPAIAGGSVVVAGIVAAMVFGPSEPKKTPAPPAPPQREVAPPPAPPPPRPEPRPPVEVTIEVSSDPAGAEVWFPGDESARGTTPLKVAMRRGEPPVSVTLKASGYLDTAVTLNPAREEAGPLNISMEKAKRERKSSSGGDSGKGKGKGKGSEHDIYKPMGD